MAAYAELLGKLMPKVSIADAMVFSVLTPCHRLEEKKNADLV